MDAKHQLTYKFAFFLKYTLRFLEEYFYQRWDYKPLIFELLIPALILEGFFSYV
jgi:hypothetical protein